MNVRGTVDWLNWWAAVGIRRFVYFSSIKTVQTGDELATEEAPGPGRSPYGASKWHAEQAVRAWRSADSQRAALILRPAVVYGPRNTANIYSFVDAIAHGRFRLIGPNRNLKSIVSIGNLCAAVLHLTDRMKSAVETFNVGDRETYSVRELAQLIASLLGVPWSGRTLPLPLCRVAALVGDGSVAVTGRPFPLTTARLTALIETTHFSIAKLLASGFRHPQTTEAGLTEMIAWYRRE